MDISLVKDLIVSRKDGHIANLNFYVGSSIMSIYPDYSIEELNSQDTQDLFYSCNLIKLDLDKSTVDLNKVTQLELHIKNKYSLNFDVHELIDKYQIAIYKLTK